MITYAPNTIVLNSLPTVFMAGTIERPMGASR